MKRIIWGVSLLLLWGCTSSGDSAYVAEVEAWQAERNMFMPSEEGWLNLAGLFWLEPRTYTFGAAPENDLRFPSDFAPPHLGTLTFDGQMVSVTITDGVTVTHEGAPVMTRTLTSDAAGEPTVLAYGDLRWWVIDRDGQTGIRVRNLAHPAVAAFSGIPTYAIGPNMRVEATLAAHENPQEIPIPTVLGTIRPDLSPGTLHFELDGVAYQLDPVLRENDRLFLIFGDATNGTETYGGGRFLWADPVDENGKTILDFNYAYNPPCAFTAYSTCPQPPPQNRLARSVQAGEKMMAG